MPRLPASTPVGKLSWLMSSLPFLGSGQVGHMLRSLGHIQRSGLSHSLPLTSHSPVGMAGETCSSP
jgi:hypothetical protein